MGLHHLPTALTCIVLAAAGVVLAADAGKTDALKQAGLSRAGDTYVLADEAAVVDGVKSLRQTKLEADRETRMRQAIEAKIATKRKTAKDADREWHTLENKLSVVQDVGVHNRIVLRMNRLVADIKDAAESEKDLQEQAGKVSSSAKTKFVDDVADLNGKAEAVAERYKTLADDADVKAALAKMNASAPAKVHLGPSSQFTSAAGS